MAKFEFDGEKYKAASKHQKEWGNSLIDSLRLSGGESILDLGCGDGVLTARLSELTPDGEVIGMDASQGMIHAAKKLEGANLAFVCLDINQMDYESRFDLIFSNAALHWVKNHKKLLGNCFKALKAGGRIAWNFAAHGTADTFNSVVLEAMTLPRFKKYFTGFEWPWYMPRVEDYTALVAESGFGGYRVTGENKDRYFESSDALIKWIDQPSLVPFLQVLPSEIKDGFRDAVISVMLEKTRQPDGRCFEKFRRIQVEARRR